MIEITILTKEEAAEMLQLSPTTLIRKAKKGEVPGRKTGKHWIFVKEHLIEWLKGDYANTVHVSQVIDRTEGNELSCHLRNEEKYGGWTLPPQTEKEYENLLGLQ